MVVLQNRIDRLSWNCAISALKQQALPPRTEKVLGGDACFLVNKKVLLSSLN